MPDEIHEAAVQAAAEVLARNDLAGGDPQLYHADARTVLAAALPHLDPRRGPRPRVDCPRCGRTVVRRSSGAPVAHIDPDGQRCEITPAHPTNIDTEE